MSCCSPVYAHHNLHQHDESKKEPFFSKQNDINKPGQRGSFFQAKLSVSEPGDKYEREADSVANAVVNKQSASPFLQQKRMDNIQRLSTSLQGPETEKKKEIQKMDDPMKEEKEKKKTNNIQAKQEAGTNTASQNISSGVDNSSGKGNQLPPKVLNEMSSSFGADFSNVRIHNDSDAVNMNRELQAQAFTHGRDIYFNQGKYNPGNSEGKFLLAHELTHVIQQEALSKGDNIQKSPLAAAAIGAAVVAAILCAYEFYEYALDNFPNQTDKWKHCWVSCKITAWCGGDAFALIIGAGKEGLDAICDAYGKGCKAEFLDFLADVEGIGCSHVPLLPCGTCCDNVTANL
ncbi:MAG: DUF4157 domain-containing protein [Bacteroidota bacterium]|nr:DUF4157 domain-containing protein [Bacteroidota bacterium]